MFLPPLENFALPWKKVYGRPCWWYCSCDISHFTKKHVLFKDFCGIILYKICHVTLWLTPSLSLVTLSQTSPLNCHCHVLFWMGSKEKSQNYYQSKSKASPFVDVSSLGSISSTFYEQLLHVQIQKAQNILTASLNFYPLWICTSKSCA